MSHCCAHAVWRALRVTAGCCRYCTVHVHAGRKTTDLRRNTLNPDWVQSFPFDATEDDDVTVMVWEWDRLKKDELIGVCGDPLMTSAREMCH